MSCQSTCTETAPFPDPFQPCVCLSLDEIFAISPSWATELHIELALGVYEMVIEPEIPTTWPECENTWCDGSPFNSLACLCMSIDQCFIDCGIDSRVDPFDGCACITETDYTALFPDWATLDDIWMAEDLAWAEWEYNQEFGKWDQSEDWLAPPEEIEPEPVPINTGAATLFTSLVATIAALFIAMN